MRIPLLQAAVVSLGMASALSPADPQAVVPAFSLNARVEPAAGTIECTAGIRSPGTSVFSLSRDLAVRRVTADGRPVAFEEAPAAPEASTRDVTVKAPGAAELVIEYGGTIRDKTYPRLVSQVNGVGRDRVELAGYAGWFPRLKGPGAFTFRLVADVPEGFVTATNARATRPPRSAGGRTVTEWESFEPTSDIVLLSAPGLRETASEAAGVRVEILAARLPGSYVGAMASDAGRAVSLLARLVGAPSPADLVRVAYSPRPGWGYVRRPLILVSEDAALAASGQESGRARDLRYVVHEIAHYWWHWADAGTPDDWINEGLSEYSAFVAARELSGSRFADELLEEYRTRSADGATKAAIAETASDSPDREVNRYARPVLILSDAARAHGSERVEAFLQALYRRFSASGRATTADFLDEAGKSLGREASEGFRAALYRKSWSDAGPARYAYSPRDEAFLGTWTGSLTQSGATTRVVLHLVLTEGALVATLDSPDQGARDIPVPTVSVSGRELRFGLGGFGIAYAGVLDGDAATIAGEWRQGGIAYPLRLSREAPILAPPQGRKP